MKKFDNYVSNLSVLSGAENENLVEQILKKYIPEFYKLQQTIEDKYGKELGEI